MTISEEASEGGQCAASIHQSWTTHPHKWGTGRSGLVTRSPPYIRGPMTDNEGAGVATGCIQDSNAPQVVGGPDSQSDPMMCVESASLPNDVGCGL